MIGQEFMALIRPATNHLSRHATFGSIADLTGSHSRLAVNMTDDSLLPIGPPAPTISSQQRKISPVRAKIQPGTDKAFVQSGSVSRSSSWVKVRLSRSTRLKHLQFKSANLQQLRVRQSGGQQSGDQQSGAQQSGLTQPSAEGPAVKSLAPHRLSRCTSAAEAAQEEDQRSIKAGRSWWRSPPLESSTAERHWFRSQSLDSDNAENVFRPRASQLNHRTSSGDLVGKVVNLTAGVRLRSGDWWQSKILPLSH